MVTKAALDRCFQTSLAHLRGRTGGRGLSCCTVTGPRSDRPQKPNAPPPPPAKRDGEGTGAAGTWVASTFASLHLRERESQLLRAASQVRDQKPVLRSCLTSIFRCRFRESRAWSARLLWAGGWCTSPGFLANRTSPVVLSVLAVHPSAQFRSPLPCTTTTPFASRSSSRFRFRASLQTPCARATWY
jgi:hypothetical protein